MPPVADCAAVRSRGFIVVPSHDSKSLRHNSKLIQNKLIIIMYNSIIDILILNIIDTSNMAIL